MNLTTEAIRSLLFLDQVNPKDRWHADQLVNRTRPEDLTDANRNWLEALAERGGEPFKKP